jgi:hypothetical protein
MTTFRIATPLLFLTLAIVACVSIHNSAPANAEDTADTVSATAAAASTTAKPAESKPAPAEVTSEKQPARANAADGDATEPADAEAAVETKDADEAVGILLRYQFKRGQFVHYEEDSRSEMTLMAREQTQATRENRKTNKHFRVISVDEKGSAVVEPVIDRVQMEVRNDNDPAVTYDSADKGDVAKDFKPVEATIGKPTLRIRYAPNGRIEELLPLVPGNPENPTGEDPEKQNFLIAFPDKAITVGEAWTDNYLIDVSVDGKLRNPLKKRVKIRRTYTLKQVKDGVAEIQFRNFPLAVERDPQVKVQLVHHSRFGMIRFDIERGIILEWKSSGSGQVFNAFGPASSMKALSSTTERYISAPPAVKRRPSAPRRPAGPAGPPLPGTASL